MTPEHGPDFGERVYRLLLRVLPGDFRREADDELVSLFQADRRRSGTGAVAKALFWIRTAGDLVVTAAAEWRSRWTSRHTRNTSTETGGRMGTGGRMDATTVSQLGNFDFPRAARRLVRKPGYSGLAATTLAVGVASMAIVITLVQQILLAPLPFPESDRLVRLLEQTEDGNVMWPSYPNLVDWRDQAASMELGAASAEQILPVLTDGEAFRLPVARAARGFFSTLGVTPVRGRFFDDAENTPGGRPVAVVSEGAWRNVLGRRPLGEISLTVEGETYGVVGVVSDDFRFLGDGAAWRKADVWLPMERFDDLGPRGSHGYHVVGRLAPGATLGQARSEMNALARRIRDVHGSASNAAEVRVEPLSRVVVGDLEGPLAMLAGAALVVLFVTIFNLAATLLVQGLERLRDVAVRRALGARRRDVVASFLSEALTLAVPATALGLFLAWAGLATVRKLGATSLPRIEEAVLGTGTGAAVAALSIGVALVAGLIPALVLALSDSGAPLRGSGRATASRGQRTLWKGFLVAQIALTATILAGSGLLLRSFLHAMDSELGYDPEPVLAAQASLPVSRYEDAGSRAEYVARALDRLEAIPGVLAVGVTNVEPQVTMAFISGTARTDQESEEWLWAGFRLVNPGYFDALDIPVDRGSLPPARPGETPGVLVDRTVVRRLFEDSSPMGGRIRNGLAGTEARVEGVVGSVREWNLDEDLVGTVYGDYRLFPEAMLNPHFLIRSRGEPEALAPAVRAELATLDPMVPLSLEPLRERVARALEEKRLLLFVAGAFALITFFLTAVGVYAMVAYVTRKHLREVGIRMALGAGLAHVRWAMLGHGLRPAALGLILGAGGAVAAGYGIRSQLFGVEPVDPLSLAGALALLGGTALLAGYIPSRRAARVDPVQVLRQE